ncbi:hypothetical protein [Pseudomonas aeruginosa]|uniref:hypothetical protein n=1 Tax=Pseudomonas aeruginosa TaxID=287 RepID=UPI0018E3D014|nr:hypothetical protein [Pseudomonas aeruginosa]MBX5700379.1 hypothetical protein [Pseudomonas aeruginosa]MDU0680278.1 hypothetical protein [Pseudomonas aeruginosa]QQD35968.1 hypothetical protein HUF09_29140 [Pseudomonas aeruginosa]UJB87464.1 hypothetical protein HUK64_19210 [Pseudomonas aeruginosa]UJB95590.1 hypothetical protein HUK67_30705 [Pseudomonas aeruginosa]
MVEPVQAALSWWELGKIVLASGVVSAVISHAIQHARDSRKVSSEKRFGAVRVVGLLDRYMMQSATNVSEHNSRYSELRNLSGISIPACVFPELEVSVDDIKSLDVEHAAKLAWLSNEITLAKGYADTVWEITSDSDDAHSYRANFVGMLGYEAYLLASEIRRAQRIPPLAEYWRIQKKVKWLKEIWKEARDDLRRPME